MINPEYRKGSVDEALFVLNRIPELSGGFTKLFLEQRLSADGLILVACIDDLPVACKIGYNRYNNDTWYSWLGGVVPEYRKLGIATTLLSELEKWMCMTNFNRIVFKTRRKHFKMKNWAEKNGFTLIERQERIPEEETRLVFQKNLK